MRPKVAGGRAGRHLHHHVPAAGRPRRDLPAPRRAPLLRRHGVDRRQRLRDRRLGHGRGQRRAAEVSRRSVGQRADHDLAASGGGDRRPQAGGGRDPRRLRRRGGDQQTARRSRPTTSTSRRSWTTGARAGSTTTPRRPRCSTAPASAPGCWSRRASTPSVARHELHGRAMLDGVLGLGLGVFGDVAHKMHNVVAVEIPEPLGAAGGDAVRARDARRLRHRDRHLVRSAARQGLADRDDGLQRPQGRRAGDARRARGGAPGPRRTGACRVVASTPRRRSTDDRRRRARPLRAAGPLHLPARRARAHLSLPRARAGQRAGRRVDGGRGPEHLAGRRRQPVGTPRGPRARAAGAGARLPPRHRARRRQLRRDARRGDGDRGGRAAGRPHRRLPVRARGRGLQRRGGHPLRQGAARQPGRGRHLGRRLVGAARRLPAPRCATPSGSSGSTRAGSARRRAHRRAWSATSRRTSSRAPISRRPTRRSAT